ncbi:MAG: terpene cyclase/mutase family protein [Planctomycetes bacterium]|nr:terpene cyclase/mutase family protein [Planctomycetota bacterium]
MTESRPLLRTEPESFHDLMAEQLRHAPWLLLSAATHALALLVLWVLFPAEANCRPASHVTVDAPDDAPVPLETPRVPEPLVEPDEPLVVDPALQPIELDELPNDRADDTDTLTAFEPVPSRNETIGILGPRTGGNGRGRHGSPPPGGGLPVIPAIVRSLEWLAAHQDEDGRWDCDGFMKHDVRGDPCDGPGSAVHDVGVTALALLAFLGDGHTMRHGKHRDRVRAAVRWLRDQQDPATGRFGQAASSDFVYDHALAAYAMCEAYGLSRYELLRPVAQRGLDYLAAHRNPYGAWRYQPRDGDNDTSVTAWCIMALGSGEGFGLTVDRSALQAAAVFLDSCTGPDGHCGYQRAGEPSARKPGDHAQRFPPARSEALTAAALFSRFFLGQDPKQTPVMQKAAQRLLARRPVWNVSDGSLDFYYWYYGSYAIYQFGGQAWREWSRALVPAVVDTQRRDGNAAGSWDPIDAWGDDGGRVYSTALLALTLEAYYRYTRLVPGAR